MTHPLTDEICEGLMKRISIYPHTDDVIVDMRAAADWQLEQVLKWLNFDYQTDPNLSRELKQRGGFSKIAIALEKAMRPQEES